MHGETYREQVETKLAKALDEVSTPYNGMLDVLVPMSLSAALRTLLFLSSLS
jgi:hypothetical protein